MRRKKKGVYAFIDSQNLNVSVQKYGWKMNWKKFRQFLTDEYGVERAFMFIGYVPEHEDIDEKMHEAGYSVVLKPTFDMSRPRPEDNGNKPEKPVKGNVDADLVLWAMKEMDNYDKAVLVSGDGDFFALVEYLQQQGRLLKILTPTGQYSRLFHQFEEYIERLDNHRRELAYHDRRPAKKPSPKQ
ncbi:MAG TPA: NYN domain-containing protein [Candidatus Saccharimonadales bacterium]|nr:NYN domain-containing protein [Candidatus Saccharimonadales bacterium]